jgi:nicotinamide-nucleotide amidase
MLAEILATGDEIRTGALVDSNSAFLAEQLEQHGVAVSRHHCVGDALAGLVAIIGEISQRADLAVVTGGLGPTVDDRTAEAMAVAAAVPLVLDEQAVSDIELFFEKRGRPCAPSNRKQAMFPEGATILYNPIGTAPGFSLKLGRCTFFCLPGVPPEMHRMFVEKALPQIALLQGDERWFGLVKTLATYGLSESVVGEKVAAIEALYPGIVLGLRAKFPEIQVKLYLRTRNETQGRELLAEAALWVRRQLDAYVFSEDGPTMAATVGQLLLARKATLAVAESCTGGLVAHWLTNTAGSSDYFLLSAVTYHNGAKVKALGVSLEMLQAKGAVHEETARQMAQGARRLGQATYGLATTGIAGPSGGSPEKPVGQVCIGLATPQQSFARTYRFTCGLRLMNKRIFAMTALDMLRRHLLGLDGAP